MNQVYAICTIDGAIRLTDTPPADGQFGLAVGDSVVLSEVIWETATHGKCLVEEGAAQLRVPGTDVAGDGRSNLQAIATYIQRLKGLERTSTIIEFDQTGTPFLRWTVDERGLVVDSGSSPAAVWCGVEILNLAELKPGDRVEYSSAGHTGAIAYPVKSIIQTTEPTFRAMGV